MRPLPNYLRPARYGRTIAELTKKESCLPASYLAKFNFWEAKRPPKLPQFRQAIVGKGDFSFSEDRPWTHSFLMRNRMGVESDYIVKPLRDWFWFKGDVVEIMIGKDKGKQGNIYKVYQERNWVLVTGLNMYRQWPNRYRRNDETDETTKKQLMEAPLTVGTHVALIDPGDRKPTEVEWRYSEEGERVRVSLRTGRIIPIPSAAEETYAYKTRQSYPEHPQKDTVKEDVIQVTFTPQLRTFEMDVMEAMNIKEERVPKKTYWC